MIVNCRRFWITILSDLSLSFQLFKFQLINQAAKYIFYWMNPLDWDVITMNRKSSERNRPIACDCRFDTFAEAVTRSIAVICNLMSLFTHTQRRACEMGKCTRLHCVLTRDRSSHVQADKHKQLGKSQPIECERKKNIFLRNARASEKIPKMSAKGEFLRIHHKDLFKFNSILTSKKKEIRTNNRMTNLDDTHSEMKINRIACVPRGTSYRFQPNAFAL